MLRLSIDVFLSVPKPPVLSSLLPKLSELNVMSLTPVFTQRSFLKNQQQINYSRLNKICEESLKQCARKIPLKIYQAVKLRDLKNLDRIKNSHLIFPFEGEKTKWIYHYPLSKLSESQSINFSSADNPNLSHQSICLLIGPEGGFELNEADFIQKNGFKAVSLGPHVMKVETACIYSVACINALFFREVPYQYF